MVALLKHEFRAEASFDEVLARHPRFPRLIALKIDVQRRGVYTPQAVVAIDPALHQLRSPYIFGSRDGAIEALPESLLLRDGTTILVDPTPLEQDPYIVDHQDGRFVLVDEGRVVEEVDLWPKPAYYDLKTSSGLPMAVMEHGRIIETGDVLDVFVRPRTPTGRALVTTATGGDPPEVVMRRLVPNPVPGGGIVLRIVFRGSLADQPVISQLSRGFSTDMNLLHGRLDAIDDASFGVLVAEVTGPPAGIQATIAFLHSNRLDVEVLGYVPPSLRATG